MSPRVEDEHARSSASIPADAVLLAIETSTRSASVALVAGDFEREVRLDDSRRHATDLIPTVDALESELGQRLTHLAVGLGPGSYTGLRVGLATALGLARGRELPVLGVPSFEHQAHALAALDQQAAFATNAFGGRHYLARYERTASDVRPLDAPAVVTPEELRTRLAVLAPSILVTDAATAPHLPAPPTHVDHPPSALALARLARIRLAHVPPTPMDALDPLYLQPFAPTPKP